jgi:hypothetical protein
MSSLKGVRSRIERLERGTKGTECDACIQTAKMQIAASYDSSLSAPSSCPACGNPNPQIPISVAREIVENADRIALNEKRVTARKLQEKQEQEQRVGNKHVQ